MNNLKKVLESNSMVRFHDCDPFNHLNNARYIDYFLNAREDQISEHYNLDVYEMAMKKKLGWVVSSNQIAYFRPALVKEHVVIESQLIDRTNKSLTVEMRMWNKDKTQLKAVLWISFIHFNLKTNKVELHSNELMELFDAVVLPVDQSTFEERSNALRYLRLTPEMV